MSKDICNCNQASCNICGTFKKINNMNLDTVMLMSGFIGGLILGLSVNRKRK